MLVVSGISAGNYSRLRYIGSWNPTISISFYFIHDRFNVIVDFVKKQETVLQSRICISFGIKLIVDGILTVRLLDNWIL